MRAERRKEQEEQLRSSQNSAKSNVFFLIVSGLYIAFLAVLLFFLFKLNVIPGKFLWAGVGVLVLITLLTVPALISIHRREKNNESDPSHGHLDPPCERYDRLERCRL